jgi:hypothetical protein
MYQRLLESEVVRTPSFNPSTLHPIVVGKTEIRQLVNIYFNRRVALVQESELGPSVILKLDIHGHR